MKKNYIVFATLIFANVVAAQKIEGIAGFIQFGYLNTPNAELLNQFYPNNNSGFSNNYFSFGAEAFYRTNKNMIIG